MEEELFQPDVLRSGLEKYASVTDLTVQVYGADGRLICGPVHRTSLFELFALSQRLGIFEDCLRRCLAPTAMPPAVVVEVRHGLAVVGCSLKLAEKIVGAGLAGYVLIEYPDEIELQRLACDGGVSFETVWSEVRKQLPVTRRRLTLCGELLQMLGETLLTENVRTRQHQQTSVRLAKALRLNDEFLAVLSHELRQPLAPLLAWTYVLKQRPDRVHEAIEMIERNVRLEMTLVNDLLDLTGIAHGKLQLDCKPLDLREVVRSALENIAEPAGRKAIRVESAFPGEILPVEGDAGRLQQVFSNLLSNAVKFTPREGSLTVTLAREGTAAVVRVRDTGVGIAPEFLPSVFDMFRQQEEGVRRTHGGLGIGLALAKRLTELHRGRIQVESPGIGQGAEFIVRLPLSAQAALEALGRTATETDARGPVLSLEGLTILVVEDNADTAHADQAVLEAVGARVVVATEGRAALGALAREDVDIIVCDLRMPVMDGFEFIRCLRLDPAWARLPVVAVSGLASDTDLQLTREAGFAGHLAKPFDPDALLAALRTIASERSSGGHAP